MSVNEVKIKRVATDSELRGTGTGPDTSRTFVLLGDEDHTLGNAPRHVLIKADTYFGGSKPLMRT